MLCKGIQLQGYIQTDSKDLDRLKAGVEMTNNDIFTGGKHIREQIQCLPTQAQKEQSSSVHD